MVFSLLVAFIVTPWAAVAHLLKPGRADARRERGLLFTVSIARVMGPILHVPAMRYGFLLRGRLLLLGSMSLVYVQFVKVKMLPFDNKSEFQVIVDMPERHDARRDCSRGPDARREDLRAARGN